MPKTWNRIVKQTELTQLVDGDILICKQGGVQKDFEIEALKDYLFPVGDTYIQFPGDSDPSTLEFPGTWSNVSSELAGDFIRFEGGNALAYDAGQQLDALQGHKTELLTNSVTATKDLGANDFFSIRASGPAFLGRAASDGVNTATIGDPIADLNGNGTPRTDTETRSINRTVRKWRRTA